MHKHLNENESEILSRIKGLILDLDGVLHVGPRPIEGLETFMNFTYRRSIRNVYVTNNSTMTPEALCERLSGFGIQASETQIITSATATARYLTEVFPERGEVFLVGEEGLYQAVKDAGFKIGDTSPVAVVVGMDRRIDYQKISAASTAILNGARFVACNVDSGAPKEGGIAPGAGSMVAAIQAVVQTPPVEIGKPEPRMFLEAVQRLALESEECAAVGDRLDIDIAAAHLADLPSILVLSGMTRPEMIEGSLYPPDLIYEDIVEMVNRWEISLGVPKL
ncbi:MAG: HAD-IIA family hydrolase [Anaerolineaceae bacterium]|nr:MAG: HAD-IIA family hydrolase [Anaerolineaceae bacterium]